MHKNVSEQMTRLKTGGVDDAGIKFFRIFVYI